MIDKHCADELYSTVNILMNAIQTEDEVAHQDAVHQMLQIAKSWKVRRWSELNLVTGKPPVQISMQSVLFIGFDWTKAMDGKLMALVE